MRRRKITGHAIVLTEHCLEDSSAWHITQEYRDFRHIHFFMCADKFIPSAEFLSSIFPKGSGIFHFSFVTGPLGQ